MKIVKPIHYSAAALVIIAGLILARTTFHSFSHENRWYRTAGNLLAVDLRKYLRSEFEPLMNQTEWFIKNEYKVEDIFKFLEKQKNQGIVSSAFIDQYQTTSKNAGKQGKTSRNALNTANELLLKLNIQIIDSTLTLPEKTGLSQYVRDIIRSGEKERTFRIPRYMSGRRDSSVVWAVFPVNVESDSQMTLLGLGFRRQKVLDEVKKQFILEMFPQMPVWQWIVWPGENNFALELKNHRGEPALIIGSKKGKILLENHSLPQADLEYAGWSIDVWCRELSYISILLEILLITAGIFIYVWTNRTIKRQYGIF